jgi:hypothetical protein
MKFLPTERPKLVVPKYNSCLEGEFGTLVFRETELAECIT